MKIDKFDQISEKLLTKLNEDYMLFEGTDETADGLSDPKEVLKSTLKTKADKEDGEAHKAFQNIKKFSDSPNKEMNVKIHKKEIIDREAAKNKLRQVKLFESQEVLSEDELNDFDLYELAEEFDRDLEEANDQMLKNAKALKDIEQNKIQSDKEQFKKDEEELKQETEQKESELEDSKLKKQEEIRQQQANDQKDIQDAQAQQNKEQEAAMKKHEDKLNKIKAIEKAAKSDGGTNPMLQNEEYAENMQMFKDAQEKRIQLEEGIIKALKARHKQKQFEKAAKQKEKVDAKAMKIQSKIDDIVKKNPGLDPNQPYEYASSPHYKKHHEKKAFKAAETVDKLKKQLETLDKYKGHAAEKKLETAEYEKDAANKAAGIQEDLEFYIEHEQEIDALLESCDTLLTEIELEESEFLEESKNSNRRYDEAIKEFKKEPEENNGVSENPMIEKIKKELIAEHAKDEPDQARIKELEMKLKQYKENRD